MEIVRSQRESTHAAASTTSAKLSFYRSAHALEVRLEDFELYGIDRLRVDSGGNAVKAGLRAGDQVLYTSSFFGDELWPADKLGFTKTAIQTKPDSVYFVVNRGVEVDVKRLTKRPAPPRFGRILTEAQKAS
ncbi:hypothetical protein ZIOFF_055471 [Zingiber officinale]|uniref:PDZ domain-containing protein n=1 Tax=Zingiber officinale TaxID=94328 RepID=A0A8J5KSC0_ZINOF|nr:hypothetical protein ZIOFF_055471 [Zingiber officinale]